MKFKFMLLLKPETENKWKSLLKITLEADLLFELLEKLLSIGLFSRQIIGV
jgi:hypothetical protein